MTRITCGSSPWPDPGDIKISGSIHRDRPVRNEVIARQFGSSVVVAIRAGEEDGADGLVSLKEDVTVAVDGNTAATDIVVKVGLRVSASWKQGQLYQGGVSNVDVPAGVYCYSRGEVEVCAYSGLRITTRQLRRELQHIARAVCSDLVHDVSNVEIACAIHRNRLRPLQTGGNCGLRISACAVRSFLEYFLVHVVGEIGDAVTVYRDAAERRVAGYDRSCGRILECHLRCGSTPRQDRVRKRRARAGDESDRSRSRARILR